MQAVRYLIITSYKTLRVPRDARRPSRRDSRGTTYWAASVAASTGDHVRDGAVPALVAAARWGDAATAATGSREARRPWWARGADARRARLSWGARARGSGGSGRPRASGGTHGRLCGTGRTLGSRGTHRRRHRVNRRGHRAGRRRHWDNRRRHRTRNHWTRWGHRAHRGVDRRWWIRTLGILSLEMHTGFEVRQQTVQLVYVVTTGPVACNRKGVFAQDIEKGEVA